MASFRRYTAVLGTLFASIAIVLVAAPAQAAGTNYVALGDSYASGLGAGSYIASSGNCSRSTQAYPALWAAAHSPSAYVSVACADATTNDVRTGQVSALSSATTLVSVTVGGNDAGFATIMATCVVAGTSACVAAVQAGEDFAGTVLPGRLDSAYAAISGRAPNARVVVLDYPVFYQLGVWYCVGLSETSRAKIDEGINLLDAVIAAAAARHGFVFGDVRAAFVGHQLCSGAKWLHALNYLDLDESYHPFASGQRYGYLPVFSAAEQGAAQSRT